MIAVSDTRANHVLNMAGAGTRDFNCWGATQYVLRSRDSLAWIEFQEMSRWLTQNTETVKQAETGDVLALFQKHPLGKLLVHTAVYLGDGLYLHKLGQNRAERATLRQVLSHYKGTGHELRRLKCD